MVSPLAERVAALVDSTATGRVVVVGSLPPHGRDLDLVVRAPQRPPLERGLLAGGLVRKDSCFALFGDCSAYAVELIVAHEFLPQDAEDELFAQARPLPGFRSLARPCPGHALLILARLVVDEGWLSAKRRQRLERILAEDSQAWAIARRSARGWGFSEALAALERAASTGRPLTLRGRLRSRWPKRALGRPKRGLLVALSGIDGAGKSSQARWLQQSLIALDAPVEVVWNNLMGENRILGVVAAAPKALLGLTGGRRRSMARYDHAASDDGDVVVGALRGPWSLLVTLTGALEQRRAAIPARLRGRTVVFDRSPLDLAVRMQVLYRSATAAQRRLIFLAAPRPDIAFLLDIAPEVSLRRKHDIWKPAQLEEQAMLYRALAPRFGAIRLDGQRPAADIAAELACRAWLALR